MVRGAKTGGEGCNDDLACAHLNLQRALARDDSFMPAFNQLALYYLEQARGGAGRTKGSLVVSGQSGRKINKQRLDLAALVASQAQKKNPNYAPIHNTTVLILVELENYNGAVKAFKNATKLNPKFFEAQMNYAAVNLSFRGFGEAEKAYRAALSQRPDTYEAHLGLALALRGGIDDTNFAKNVAESQKHLDEAKKLEPSRPEAFYNEAILAQEYRAKRAGNDAATITEFNKAIGQYQSFIAKAQGKPAFEQAGLAYRPSIEVDSPHHACALVKNGSGFSVVDEISWRASGMQHMAVFPILQQERLTVSLVHLRREPLAQLAQTFVEQLRGTLRASGFKLFDAS
jgi:tetratricopeptide (TPR) repeat protein